MSTADQQRRWRASKGARTGQPGRTPARCGTAAAFRRHVRKGEPLDPECDGKGRAEEARRQADLYQRRKSTGI